MFWLFSLQNVRTTILLLVFMPDLFDVLVILFLFVDPISTHNLALEEQQVTAVRLLQLSSNLAVCPPGM
jgi:hypothetical protein